MGDDVTIEILKQIRDETRGTREELHVTREELSERLEQMRLQQKQTEIRLASELIAWGKPLRRLQSSVQDALDMKQQVEDHELRIRELERSSG